jgi:hypothetical protein
VRKRRTRELLGANAAGTIQKTQPFSERRNYQSKGFKAFPGDFWHPECVNKGKSVGNQKTTSGISNIQKTIYIVILYVLMTGCTKKGGWKSDQLRQAEVATRL